VGCEGGRAGVDRLGGGRERSHRCRGEISGGRRRGRVHVVISEGRRAEPCGEVVWTPSLAS
jgi:hypothetical protein